MHPRFSTSILLLLSLASAASAFAQGTAPEAVEATLRDAFARLRFEWAPLLDVLL